MAFRNVFGLALLLGGVLAVGCGGSSGKVTHDLGDDPPPTSGDQPPLNPDRPSGSDDQPPSSSGRPPSNPDSPSGGRLQELCSKLCEVIDRCDTGANMDGMDTSDLCSEGGCRLPPGIVETAIPCGNEMIALLDCALGLSNLCAADGSPQDEANEQQCREAIQGFERCDEYEPPDTDPPDPPNNEDDCTIAGGCECENPCQECYCAAGNNADLTAQCAQSSVCM